MKNMKKKLLNLITKAMRFLPGGELKSCENIGPFGTECIEPRGHKGKCEDAWFQKWDPSKNLKPQI